MITIHCGTPACGNRHINEDRCKGYRLMKRGEYIAKGGGGGGEERDLEEIE